MKKKKRKKHLVYTIMRLSILPISVLGIILTVYGQKSIREGMIFEVQANLSGISHNLISMYNIIDAGDFSCEEGKVKKGETDLTSDYRMLDDIKNDTGADVTIFIGNQRCLTTLLSDDGKRMTGTKVSEEVGHIVLEEGKEYFSQNVDVVGTNYFGYYVPIRNDANEVIGISFAGKSVDSINTSMNFMIHGNIIICLFVILLMIVLCRFSAQRMVLAIHGIRNFLGKLAHGDFSVRMPEAILQRQDELGEMGEYAVTVSKSLEEMVTRDPLTKLLNRRAGQNLLNNRRGQNVFSLVMADIDYFKKVNDTYGHEKGDEVLCFIAEQLRELTADIGFSVRWGGEEFLLGFDVDMDKVEQILVVFKKRIQEEKFVAEEEIFSVTMTFGAVSYEKDETMDAVIRRADELLYYGKKHGRDRIITECIMAAEEAGLS